MFAWQKMAWHSECELARYSSATKNLACTEGLPGTEYWDHRRCLGAIRELAEKIRWKTLKHWRKFEKNPENFEYSFARYRMLVLVSTLQQDCGIRYNPAKIPDTTPPRFLKLRRSLPRIFSYTVPRWVTAEHAPPCRFFMPQ